MLPEIPAKLLKLDEFTVGEHFLLSAADQCYYIWEYTAGKNFKFSPSNQLISNLKIKPTQIEKSPNRGFYKRRAIEHSAAALRQFLPRAYAEHAASFIPVPGSKALGDPDYDDRTLQVLQCAFAGWAVDIRPLLSLTQSTAADHESEERLTYDELLSLSTLTIPVEPPLRPLVVVIDDVLNSGKHFRVAQNLITRQFPNIAVRGLFLARCIREDGACD